MSRAVTSEDGPGVPSRPLLLEVRDLTLVARTAVGDFHPVRSLSLAVGRGERLGVIGESGSGKTTAARAVVGELAKNIDVASGRIVFDAETVFDEHVDHLAAIRGDKVSMIFQSPRASLNPVRKVGSQLRELLHVREPTLPRAAAEARIVEVLRRMQFTDVKKVVKAYPHELSGGMCQRVAIAMAVLGRPELLIADECTSALDVTTQAEVVGLLRELCDEQDLALIFVTHDLLLAAQLCTRLAVMYGGAVVEEGPTIEVMTAPRHPYTKALLATIPDDDGNWQRGGIPGQPVPVSVGMRGCPFRPRCPEARAECADTVADRVVGDHTYRCVLVGDDSLA